jgi:hypothetical protein
MITKNDWLTTNINQRFKDRTCNFEAYLNLYPFKKIDFYTACDNAAIEIYEKYKNLYLGLSGGLDSEYVLRVFHRLKIPIIPIIVSFCNEKENDYAYKVCRELNITPVTVKPSNKEFIKTYYEEIHMKYNGLGIHMTHVFIAKQSAKNGTFIGGAHMMGDSFLQNNEVLGYYNIIDSNNFFSTVESDHYIPDVVDLMLYKPEITYSIIGQAKKQIGVEWSIFKSNLYNLEPRIKIRPEYSEDFIKVLTKLRSLKPQSHVKYWSVDEILEIFDKYHD